MNPAEAELWRRIAEFEFDDPEAAWPFSARLAKENGWSPEFAARALTEYRRFAFLAVAGTTPVSPSEVVDQVWHEHLVFTRNYWDEFCGKALGQKLHHEPTRGGNDEQNKFETWYKDTLETYRHYFGEPPADIWPSPERRSAEKSDRISVDRSRHWVLPKWPFASFKWWLAACIPIAVVGCTSLATLGPLDWSGPDFLRLWIPATGILLAIAGFLRWSLRGGNSTSGGPTDPTDVALLAGGPMRVVEMGVASLYRRQLLGVSKLVLQAKGELPADASPVERRIISACKAGVGARQVGRLRRSIAPVVAPRERALIKAGFLVDGATVTKIRTAVVACMVAPLTLGLAKIGVGLSRDRPVMFLVVGTSLAAIVTMVLLRRPLRTRAGDAALEKLRQERNYLAAGSPTTQMSADSGSTLLAVALFGATVLPALGMTSLQSWLRPAGDSSVGGTSGSSCGGGGGGGDGGGGGGGGGGCGGCGGGGGD